jgi:hypothetical protein
MQCPSTLTLSSGTTVAWVANDLVPGQGGSLQATALVFVLDDGITCFSSAPAGVTFSATRLPIYSHVAVSAGAVQAPPAGAGPTAPAGTPASTGGAAAPSAAAQDSQAVGTTPGGNSTSEAAPGGRQSNGAADSSKWPASVLQYVTCAVAVGWLTM